MAYKCRVFSSYNEGDLEAYENLMTKARETDSVSIVQQETKLTESGNYLVAVHWIEEPQDKDNEKKSLDEMIDEGF